MRIGIYNRWLSTLGGGEKHSLAIAEYLSHKHDVDVLSHKPVSKELAEKTLALDLSRVNFVIIPEQSSLGISAVSRDYDLFINASYMDVFPALSKHSAILVYFPGKLNWHIAVRRKIKQLSRRLFQLPDMLAGIQTFEMTESGFCWYLDTVARLRIPTSRRNIHISFDVYGLDPQISQIRVCINNHSFDLIELKKGTSATHCEVCISPIQGKNQEINIESVGKVKPDGRPKLRIENINIDLPAYQFYRTVFEHRFKGWAIRLQYNPPAYAVLDYLKTYDIIWANSEYSRKWIRKYWHCDSHVLYPLVDVDLLAPATKRQQIINVGRFFSGNHNKKHIEMIQTFREMVDDGLKGWELHLVGGTMADEIHQKYYEQVCQAAKGYPIFIHPNAPRAELVRLYAESAIYWHASGYGENESRDPDRFEHFGITTVEAMASGCCPVVIDKGGQPEIVEQGINGYLWQTLDELKTMTLLLIRDTQMRERISIQAVSTSKRFGKATFHKQLDIFMRYIEEEIAEE